MRNASDDVSGPGAAVVAAALLICCAGPLLLAALASAGVGAWLLGQGLAYVSVAAILVAGVLGFFALRRGSRSRAAGQDAGCCAPAKIQEQERVR